MSPVVVRSIAHGQADLKLSKITPMLCCVSIVAIDPVTRDLLLVRKTKGPAHIRGKLTFPGGKLESSDASPAHAAAREAFEEAGLVVKPMDLVHLLHRGDEKLDLHVFVAMCDLTFAGPQPLEEEQVFKAQFEESLESSKTGHPDADDYVNDTHAILASLLKIPRFSRVLNATRPQHRSSASPT